MDINDKVDGIKPIINESGELFYKEVLPNIVLTDMGTHWTATYSKNIGDIENHVKISVCVKDIDKQTAYSKAKEQIKDLLFKLSVYLGK